MSITQWWRDNVDGPIFGARWVTLKGGKHVRIDGDGRITHGGPPEWEGVHVKDVSAVSRKLRELAAVDCTTECKSCPLTFPVKAAGVAALLEANAELFEHTQRHGSGAELAYRDWLRGGRRGKKPALKQGDGRFDSVNEAHELKGPRAVSSWLEAVHVTVPSSRRWADFSDRLPPLEDALGFRLNLPGPAEKARIGKQTAAECNSRRDDLVDELLSGARAGRVPGGGSEVPF